MSDLKCARTLVLAAERDLEVLQLMLEHSGGSDEVFGFHVQQAVEKLLKAWLAIRGETYPLTHDLELLFEALALESAELEVFRSLSGYTPFAVIHRYEALGPQEPPTDRAQAILRSTSLLARVRELLDNPTRA
ncbi:MAG: HEPN domain-containing protein [Bryobacterales bacterium]|nr:HEPN domain-containing protein [Bryobacterales bacterium]MDE0629820.1 HEPN domain-containing protein [Bryobacterales bacterium]